MVKYNIYLTDPPGAPSNPEIADKTKNSVTLNWNPPEKDGGSPIKGYIVEYQEEGDLEWKRANQPDKLIPTTTFTVPDLRENRKCRFRVIAVNAAGESDPSGRSADTMVQDVLGKTFDKILDSRDSTDKMCVHSTNDTFLVLQWSLR